MGTGVYTRASWLLRRLRSLLRLRGRALARGLGLEHLHGADRHRRRERAKPVDPVQDAQRLDQRTQRRALPTLEILDGVQGDAGLIGQLLLVEVLPEPEGTDLPAQLSFPLDQRPSAQHINSPK